MTITEFNQIVDEVEKRFDPKFELVNKDIGHINEKIEDVKSDVKSIRESNKWIMGIGITLFFGMIGIFFTLLIK